MRFFKSMELEWKRNVTITTNESCNLNCIYCYENNKSNKSFDVEGAKVKLEKILNQKDGGGTTISFHGGEPFLVFDKIKTLCEWLWRQEFPEPYRCFATTNGTLVHGEIQQWLCDHRDKFICSLSLDGNREMHNANRSNSFDLIDIHFFIKTWPYQGVKMTISKKTITTLADGIIFLHKAGIPDIRANLSEMTIWKEKELLFIYKRELQKLASFYIENPEIKPCSLFNVPFFKILEDGTPQKWCGVGDAPSYDIDTDQIFPCHLFFPSVCGEEKSIGAKRIDFSKPSSYISKECAKCPFLRICPTCYGANYIDRGHPASRDMYLCNFHKIRFAVVAEYEYERIKSTIGGENNRIDEHTRMKDIRNIEGIMKIISQLNEELQK